MEIDIGSDLDKAKELETTKSGSRSSIENLCLPLVDSLGNLAESLAHSAWSKTGINDAKSKDAFVAGYLAATASKSQEGGPLIQKGSNAYGGQG